MAQQSDNAGQSNAFYPTAQFPSAAPTASPAVTGQNYSYPPPQPDAQGNPPSDSNITHPSLSLPPIRNIDNAPQAQQQPGQQGAPAPSGPPMTMYYGQSQPLPDPNVPQRWPLPPDGRVMSGGRHKKEIKRRTKTGCLTCRKRRIKCDEAHPTCRNCQKSKRDCLGYDPIFKQQPAPTAIQPAGSAASSLQPGSTNTSPYPPPQGYTPQNYGPPGTNSEHSIEPNEYGATIDPALQAAQMQDSKEALGAESPYPQAQRTKIEQLLCLRNYTPPPPVPPAPVSTTQKDEIKEIWLSAYAPGIDKFLETRWFGMRGLNHLLENQRLCNQFLAMIDRFTAQQDPLDPNYHHKYCITQSLEATVIWAMMGMCRQVTSRVKSENESEEIDELDVKEGVHEAAKRLEIFEVLVTGEYLDTEPGEKESDEGSNASGLNNQLKTRERRFWSLVHKFLTIRDDEASSAKEIDDTLASCRQLLDSRENRDVIYSIMIARHVGARMAEFPNNLPQAESNDEADNRNKLAVAKTFIEEQGVRGTNQVVQRLCGMAVRSWALKR